MIIENLIDDIRSHHAEFVDLFEQIEIPSKATLLEQGQVSRYVFFIKKGALRTWTDNNGEDITVQFLFEGQVASSFMGRGASSFSIESIEPSTIYRITIENFDKIVAAVPQYKDMMIEILLQRLRHYNDLFISRIKYSPEERYAEIEKNDPQLLRCVPMHYIATYLGITSVSLSRIRNRRLRGGDCSMICDSDS